MPERIPAPNARLAAADKVPAPGAVCDTRVASASPAVPDSIPAPSAVAGISPVSSVEASKPAVADNLPAPKETCKFPAGKKAHQPAKGKSSGGNPKDRYGAEYAPEVMRPTAEYLLYKMGRKGLRLEEISILRELSAIHYPTVVNKEIRRACERFEKRKQPLECLTLMYIAVGLRKWCSFGKKELSEEKKKYFAQYEPKKKTEEEKAAILAEMRELEASL